MGYEIENKLQKAMNEIERLKKENSRLHNFYSLNEMKDSTKSKKLKKRVNLFRIFKEGKVILPIGGKWIMEKQLLSRI